jgi:hypothetical protein
MYLQSIESVLRLRALLSSNRSVTSVQQETAQECQGFRTAKDWGVLEEYHLGPGRWSERPLITVKRCLTYIQITDLPHFGIASKLSESRTTLSDNGQCIVRRENGNRIRMGFQRVIYMN